MLGERSVEVTCRRSLGSLSAERQVTLPGLAEKPPVSLQFTFITVRRRGTGPSEASRAQLLQKQQRRSLRSGGWRDPLGFGPGPGGPWRVIGTGLQRAVLRLQVDDGLGAGDPGLAWGHKRGGEPGKGQVRPWRTLSWWLFDVPARGRGPASPHWAWVLEVPVPRGSPEGASGLRYSERQPR